MNNRMARDALTSARTRHRHPLIVSIALMPALFALAPVPAMAQAPGAPISTTVLDPPASQEDGGTGNEPPDPRREEGGGGESDAEAGHPASATVGADTGDAANTDAAPDAVSRPPTDPDADTAAGIAAATVSEETPEPDVQALDQPIQADAPAPEPVEVPSAAAMAQDLLAGLWREAVATGETVLGFEAWLGETPGGTPGNTLNRGAASPTDIPADQAGRTRLASERWHARAGSVALGAAGRVVTTFGSAIPTAFCAPLMVCYIELEPGEILTETPSVGDTVRWQVAVKTQGFDPETVLIEVKPTEDAQVTNLVIPTDRRFYTINLVNDPEVHTPILSFLYPDSAARRFAEQVAAREAREAEAQAATEQRRAQAAAARAAELKHSGVRTATATVSADRLDFGFRVDGKAPFRPVRVFADGRRTYIDLHPNYRGAMPVIIAGPGEENAALNTRVTNEGTRLVADRVISDIWLQSGRKRIRIRKVGS